MLDHASSFRLQKNDLVEEWARQKWV